MRELTGKQRKYLRGRAHALKPVVLIGAKGLTPEQIKAIDAALLTHELIKVKFLDHKEEKQELATAMATTVSGHLAGMIGNIAILYRPHPDPEKRRISLDAIGAEE
ncbi:MAG TPA: ribosome assembly RNA-binding protein YhbY [bacterium]|nr:ribosome assembly RNA-binding protein YhbY [bacterium]